VEAIKNLNYAKEKRGLEQRLDAREHETAQLRRELVTAENRLASAGRRFTLWRKRIKLLTKRIRQQRVIMRELRDEMRQREQFDSGLYRAIELRSGNEKSEAAAPSQTEAKQDAVATPPPVEATEAQDNLRKIRGIGAALEQKLHEQGIFRMQQLAELGSEELAKLGKTLGVSDKMMARHDWAKQARELLGLPERIAETDATAQAEAISA
jgi:predicted flap endonuclease-1-like 5' DNA nuclease